MEGDIFDCLPDCVLLKIINYIDFSDRQALSLIRPRLKYLCYDMTIVRRSIFEGCYTLHEDDLKQYVQYSGRHIQVLNFNHCYWLTQRILQFAIKKCCYLKELHVIQCNLTMDVLVSLLEGLPNLRSLSFSIPSFSCIEKNVFQPAQETVKNLRSLCIYYSSHELTQMQFIGERLTFFDFCENLEELTINSAEISIPELGHPKFSNPKTLETVKSMSLSSNIHAGASVLFYGTLGILARAKIPWEKLLMPNINFTEFSKKPEYKGCLDNVTQLKYLDISGSPQHVDNCLNILAARQLRYYNVSKTKIAPKHLSDVASSCHNLASLNIYECSQACFQRSRLDVSGLSNLLTHCSQLRHLNFGGVHYHVKNENDEFSKNEVKQVIGFIKGLHSLGFPTCLLSCLCHCTSLSLSSASSSSSSSSSSSLVKSESDKRYSDGYSMQPKRFCRDSEVDVKPDLTSISVTGQNTAKSESVLEQISANNQDLRSLEIISVDYLSSFHKNKFINPDLQKFEACKESWMVRDSDLLPISTLRHLTDLTIIGVPSLKGSSLVEIARGCEKLGRLSLAYVGEALSGVNTFSKVLIHLKRIKDIRLEQPTISLDLTFFSALSNCKLLQRFCVIAKLSHFEPNGLMRSVDQLPYLAVIQLFTGETLTMCHRVAMAIKKRFGKSRPGLSVCIYPLHHKDIKELPKHIPAKHFSELTRFSSRICSLPPQTTS